MVDEKTEGIRWDKIEPIYKEIIDKIYDNEFNGMEVDILVDLIETKVKRDKLFATVYLDVTQRLMMEAVAAAVSPEKETLKKTKDDIYQ